MNQKKSLLILCGVLIVIIGAYVGVTKYNENKELAALEEEAILEELNTIYITQLDSDSIVEIEWSYDNELSFALDGEEWVYTEDTSVALESSYLESVLSAYVYLTAERELVDGEGLDSYGLEEPMCTVTLTDDSGVETAYYIGNTASDDNYYLTINDKENIYTVTSDVVDVILYDVTDMVVRDTFSIPESEELQWVTVVSEDSETIYTSADEGAFDMFADGLSILTFTDCIDVNASEELESYALDEEQRITWTMVYGVAVEEETTEESTDEATEESTEETIEEVEMEYYEETLYIGYYVEIYDTYYLQVEGSDKVYSIAADTVDRLLFQYVESEDDSSDTTYDISSYFY